MLDTHEFPRSDRTPVDYANQILSSISESLIDLGKFKSEDEFIKDLMNPVIKNFVEHGFGGEEIYRTIVETGIEELKGQIVKVLAAKGEMPPDCPIEVDNRGFWGTIAVAYCIQVFHAHEHGDVTAAWTYAMDARFAADSLLSLRMDKAAVRFSKERTSKIAAYTRLAKDPVQAAKKEAFKLWSEWQSGETLHKSAAAFQRFVLEKFPVITSTKTVERWCVQWSKKRSQDRDSTR
ncbi:hypothetical protein ACN9MB_07425 [Dyella kyungheensis]|uniref:hypothetical protein n=1 Tax=Dyella kyungheensis TaxID=1242174 RepID=UPI003CECB72C